MVVFIIVNFDINLTKMTPEESEVTYDLEEMDVLEAETVYLLMKKEYRISRSVRAQWFLDHLNTTITVKKDVILDDCEDELTIISVIPNQPPLYWKVETSHCCKYLVTPHTSLIFLGHRYRIVYCLDMSPSLSAVDIQHGEIMIDEMFLSLKTSLDGLTRPFIIPGSLVHFQPQIIVTVIAHTPFFTTPAQQVLVQGWQVTPENLNEFLESIRIQLERLEDIVAEVAGVVHEQLEAWRVESEKLVGGLFEEHNETAHIPMVNPDSGFINMLRYGMLALRLLPESSCANLIILTDGIIAVPDVRVFDSVLTQLRMNTVACSFLHVGSLFHPQCCKGMVPYADLMNFIATATFGTYLTTIPKITSVSENQMNMYHRAFLSWNFSKGNNELDLDYGFPQRTEEWHVSNSCFYGVREPQLLRKKQMEDKLSTSLPHLLCCRLREGYTIRHISATDNRIEINMVLPWKNHVYIEYIITSQLSSSKNTSSQSPSSGMVHYSVCIEAPYEFLHDITCLLKKPFKSPYRQAVVSRFWGTLKNLTHSDQLLVHLNSFHTNPASYTVPDGIRSGMPVFYLPLNSSVPVLSSSDMTSSQFAQFWLPVCTLEPQIWQKWLHTERLGLIMLHDHPLPKHLHLPNTSGRFQVVQCRQAAAALNSLLKDWSTFVLIENHTYVKLIAGDSDKPPTSFYIIRVTSKPPCVVINMAFLGGTSGLLRYEVLQELKKHIASLKLPPRPSNKESLPRKISVVRPSSIQNDDGCDNGHTPVLRTWSDITCCILLRKPVEKILIRYERVPPDFGTIVFPDGTQPLGINKHHIMSGYAVGAANSNAGSGLFTTLSRYLHHRRWIWAAQENPDASLGFPAVARILSTITKMRLQEGFNFAHSTAGIINLVLEVQMKAVKEGSSFQNDEDSGIFPCVIQYVLFPPHTTSSSARESCSDDDDDDDDEDAASDDQNAQNDHEVEGELQIITECWIEPQHGIVVNCPPERIYMEGLPYHMLADVICQIDAECISSLLTFEHLSFICRDVSSVSPVRVPDTQKMNIMEEAKRCVHTSVFSKLGSHFGSEQRIQYIPFAFNLMKILPKCQQAEELFSLFIQDLGANPPEPDYNSAVQADVPNKLLSDMLYEHLKKLNDRELYLTIEDSQRFLHLLLTRKRESDLPLPIPQHFLKLELGLETSASCAASPGSEGTVCDKFPLNLKIVPKWRCFLKGISTTHIMLTFVPASFMDLKLLMITKDTLSGNQPSAIKFISSTSVEDPEHISSLDHYGSHMESNAFSGLVGKDSSTDRINQGADAIHVALSELIGDPGLCITPTSSASAAHLSRSSSCETGHVPGQIPYASRLHSDAGSPLPQRDTFDTPFRMRASSWDTVKRQITGDACEQALDRLRAGSMDSKTRRTRPFIMSAVPVKASNSDSLLKIKRDNDVKKPSSKNSPKGSPHKLSSKSSPRKSSIDKVSSISDVNEGNISEDKCDEMSFMKNMGSITFPVYVYDCPLALLMEAIVFKDSSVKMKDIYDDRRFKLDDEHKLDHTNEVQISPNEEDERSHMAPGVHLSPEPVSDDSESAIYKPNLLHYCKILSLAYSKCFVFTLFKSLHMAHTLHSADVQAAVDECEETLIDIDITDYLKTVCGHLKDFRMKMKINELKFNSSGNSPNHGNLPSHVTNLNSSISVPTGETSIAVNSSLVLETSLAVSSSSSQLIANSSNNLHPVNNANASLDTADTPKSQNIEQSSSTPKKGCNLQDSFSSQELSSTPAEREHNFTKKCVSITVPEGLIAENIPLHDLKSVLVESFEQSVQENEPTTVHASDKTMIPEDSDKVRETPIASSLEDIGMRFPLSLLQLHTPCRDLKQLHRMIREKFMAILMTSFKPVSSYPEFYFCAPYWDKIQQDEAVADLSKPQVIETEDEGDKLTYHSGLVEFRSDHESIVGHEAPDETRTSLLSNIDSNSLSDLQDDISEDVSPLFLHLTCTLRCKDKIGSCSVRVLPTCLGELIQALEFSDSELNLNHLQVTLDVLCLTLPPEVESIIAERSLEMRNTSFCSTSPPPQENDRNLMTSASGSLLSMQHYTDEPVPSDRLKHLPDYQHKAVTTCVDEIQWLMRDEIAAFLLDIYPLQEQTLSLVADHVASSPGRASCLMEKVPLQFVFGPDQSLERFIQEFCKLVVNGYHLKQVGSLYYLVKDKQVATRKKTSSLIPPLKNFYQPHMEDCMELWNDSLRTHIPTSSDENGLLLNYPGSTLDTCISEDEPKPNMMGVTSKRSKLQEVVEVSCPLEDSDSEEEPRDQLLWHRQKKNFSFKSESEQWRGTWVDNVAPLLSASLTTSPSLSTVPQDFHKRFQSSNEDKPMMLKRSQSCGISNSKREDMIPLEQELSPARWNSVLAWQRKQQGTPGYRSEVSSLVESAHGTEDGYEGDSSDSAEENDWLEDLETCRPSLPNFWLIMRVDKDAITTYFHCRYFDEEAREVHKSVVSCIKSLCKIVNQTMLLQNLHDTRMCDQLLEPESSEDIWKNPDTSRDSTFSRMKSFDDSTDNECQGSYLEATMKFRPGWFSCNVVWETHFCLHPRLKTGPGKSLFSRGIQALRSVLNRFSVNNRKNMFVYQDISGNVFYLRLHENFKWLTKLTPTATSGSLAPGRSDTEENSPGAVSRSSSVTSLTASARKSGGMNNEEILSQNLTGESRPRIRSFGEKDITVSSGDTFTPSVTPQPPLSRPEGSVVLKVHGISEAGPQVKEELVQVLQNRLDDAVLEVLSIMLARNPMCKLTPDDVHFVQKPYKAPEAVIQFSIQPHALSHLQALAYYLRQNLLEFMYIPKYTDPRPEFHFQDYSQPESSQKRVTESDLFLYNQTPSAGNRGIACIALAVVDSPGNLVQHSHYPKPFTRAYKEGLCEEDFATLTSASTYVLEEKNKEPEPAALVEFRIWKQGRVNMDSLTQKLCAAVRHSTWDLLTEFCLLTAPITQVAGSEETSPSHMKEVSDSTEVAEDATFTNPVFIQDESQIFEADAAEVFESEDNNFLHEVYQKTMQPWLKFAVDIAVPAVKKHTVDLCARHSLAVMVKEVQNLVVLNATDTQTMIFYPSLHPETNKIVLSMSHDMRLGNILPQSEENSFCLLIGRNIDQWRACVTDDDTFDQDALFPKAQKVFQKFPPLLTAHVSGQGTQFVPRQRFLMAILTNHQITIYTYNWSKERVENLNMQVKDLGCWLSARSNLLTSILMQKMGLFHNMEIHQKQESPSQVNTYMSRLVELEDFIKFSPTSMMMKDPAPRRHGLGSPYGCLVPGLNSALPDVFRDSKPSRPMHRMPYNADPVVRNAYQLQDTRQRDRRDDQKKLYVMWHTRVATPNIPMAEDVIHLFKQHSRVIHYCLTPLLFLPRWRIQSAATRDHMLSLSSNIESSVPTDTKVKKISVGSSKMEMAGTLSHQNITPTTKLRRESEDKWHHALCVNFIQEYKQYLQTLGFIPIQTEPPAAKKTVRSGAPKMKESEKVLQKEYPESNVCYLQKSILGGILLFEISMCEPFFVAKLHALECSRLQSKTSSALVSQFTLSFLDECDKIKILMHLHSFAYDYHLRSISCYVSGRQAILKQGYHLTHFLDDFLKYYSKAPNFARNLVYADVLSVQNVTTAPQQLFNYLLSHEKVYKMEVFRMAPVTNENDSSVDNEYVLVQLENMPHVTYRDAHDMSHTDDFSVTLIVSHDSALDKQESADQSTLHLKYYIILTSTRELFPKLEIGSKLGKFRTVSTASHDPMQLYYPRSLHVTSGYHNSDILDRDNTPLEAVCAPPCVPVTILAPLTPQAPALPAPLTDCDFSVNQDPGLPVLPHHTEIRQESVNYLGYYSSHEQLMHELILERASAAQKCIHDMVAQGMEHCRTHLLWNKLLIPSRESERRKEETFSRDMLSIGLTYIEFCELRSLAVVEPLNQLDPRLSPLLSQSLTWYQSLAKVLMAKYSDHYRLFVSPDGNVQHVVVLHPRYLEAFMMLSIDTNSSRGDLCAVYRKPLQDNKQTPGQSEFCIADIQSLVEGFVNACCFHLWVNLL